MLRPPGGNCMTSSFRWSRHRIVGLIGILVAALMALQVSSAVAANKISILRVTYPGARPVDPPLLDIPLPTVITVDIIAALLIIGGVYLIIRQPPHSVPYYMGALIFSVVFTILIWAGAGSRIDIVDMLSRTVRLATPIV